jgi:uncharacterized protein YdaU (DUF1376 family)
MADKDTLASYPWYVSDWRGSKLRVKLSTTGRGIFRELMDYCWEVGSLPVDERHLTAISGSTKAEFTKEWPAIKCEFFQEDGVLKHHKVEANRPKLVNFRETRRRNATRKKHVLPSDPASDEASDKASAPACDEPIGGPSLLLTAYCSEKTSASAAAERVSAKAALKAKQQVWFEEWWPTVWLKVGKTPAEKKFYEVVRDEATFEAIKKATQMQSHSISQKERMFQKHPATWLNERRWEDDPAAYTPAQPSLPQYRETELW